MVVKDKLCFNKLNPVTDLQPFFWVNAKEILQHADTSLLSCLPNIFFSYGLWLRCYILLFGGPVTPKHLYMSTKQRVTSS